MQLEQIESIQTICRDCIFSIKENKKQVGCKLGRLEKFQEDSVVFLSEDSSYYIIDGRFCNTCRNSEWRERIVKEGQEVYAAVAQETQLKIDCLIYCQKTSTMEEVGRSIDSVLTQKILPRNITILNKPSYPLNSTELFLLLKEKCQETGAKIRWNVETVLVDSDLWGEMNFGARKCPSQYFINVMAGSEVPSWLFYKINLFLNRELKKFLVLKDGPFDGLVLSRYLFHLVGDNKNELAIDKIKELAQENSQEHMIITYEDLNNVR